MENIFSNKESLPLFNMVFTEKGSVLFNFNVKASVICNFFTEGDRIAIVDNRIYVTNESVLNLNKKVKTSQITSENKIQNKQFYESIRKYFNIQDNELYFYISKKENNYYIFEKFELPNTNELEIEIKHNQLNQLNLE